MIDTPRSNRFTIGLFGATNAGKSTLINAITNQEIALTSDIKGTTTDPVYKNMELLPIGPVTFIDTAGLDDETELAKLRLKKTYEAMRKCNLAIYVIDSNELKIDNYFLDKLKVMKIPYLLVINKFDQENQKIKDFIKKYPETILIDALSKYGIEDLKEGIIELSKEDLQLEKPLVADIVNPLDLVILVCPIDSAAPKGRLILPQQQVLRECLDIGAIPVVCREFELEECLKALNKKPDLVITDSQVFEYVNNILEDDIPLTSFSIIFARQKGDLPIFIEGVKSIESLEDGAKILIAEGCSHHRQKDDIGTVKIPKWLQEKTGHTFDFDYASGQMIPEDLTKYSLIIHCGACMLNRREMIYRIKQAKENEVKIANYGITIAYLKGITEKAMQIFVK